LVAVVAVIGLTGDDNPAKPPTATGAETGAARAGQVAQHLGAVPALRYSGTFSSGGDEFQTQLAVTKAGSATGTLTVDGAKSDLVSVDGATYLKAPQTFWRSQGGVSANAGDFADRWSKAPDTALQLDIKDVLAPGAIVRALQSVSSYQPAGAQENINGTPAVKIAGAGAEYYVSTAEPPRLLRIVGTGADLYRLDVAEVPAGEVTGLFQQMRDQVRALDSARDPSVRFIGRPTTSGCGSSSCTVRLSATSIAVGSGASSSVRAIMRATLKTKRTGGRTIGTCTDSATASGGSGKRVSLSCTVRGGAWSAWARNAGGGAAFFVSAYAVAESNDSGKLLSVIDQEQQAA
jgi:hypothetical protein